MNICGGNGEQAHLLQPSLWEQDHANGSGMLTVLRGWRDVQLRAAPAARIVLSETASQQCLT